VSKPTQGPAHERIGSPTIDPPRSWRQSLALAALEIVRPGESEISLPTLARVGRIVLTLVIVVTNLIGAGAVLVIAAFVVPLPRCAPPPTSARSTRWQL